LHRSLDLIQDLVLLDDIVDILHEASSDSSGITGVGVKGLDDFLDGDGGVAGPPSVVVGRGADECVAVESGLFEGRNKVTYSSSASRASLASGITDMLMMSPPHCLYIWDSALVEKAGPAYKLEIKARRYITSSPSIQTTVLPVWSLGDPSAFFKISSTLGATKAFNLSLNGFPNIE
jgi:hypothetical protein